MDSVNLESMAVQLTETEKLMLYLLVCFISIFAGLGIQRIVRLQLTSSVSIMLAPILTLSVWAIVLGWLVLFGMPIKEGYSYVWILTGVLSLLGITKANLFTHRYLLLCCLVLPVLVMLNYFWFGLTKYPGLIEPDGWSYIAVAQYLWEYSRGTEGGLAPLYQYAAHLNHARFISSSLIAFLSSLGVKGDTQQIANVYLAWLVFVYASACAFFGLTQQLKQYLYPYLLLSVFTGWLILLLGNNNVDNLAALAFLPALAGGFSLLSSSKKSWSFVISVLFAAALFIYPELSPCVVLGVLLFSFASIVREPKALYKKYATLVIMSIGLVICILSPYLPEFIAFFTSQSGALNVPDSLRPGATFNLAMLDPNRILFSFWGLHHNIQSEVLSIMLTLLFFYGVVRACKDKRWEYVIFSTVILIGVFLMIFKYRYPYGAFKFLLMTWWLLAFFVVLAIKNIIEKNRHAYVLKSIVIILFLTYSFIVFKPIKSILYKASFVDITSFRQLEDVKKVTHDEAILVDVDNQIANEWAVYYLRKYKIKLVKYKLPMTFPWVVVLMDRSASIDPSQVKFVLTDVPSFYPGQSVVWSAGPYFLLSK